MQVKDVMTKDVEIIAPDSTVMEAAQKMKELDIGPLPVCDGDKVVGMITDRDITIRAVANGLDVATTQIQDILGTDQVIWCYEDASIEEAAQQMKNQKIRRLLVVNRDKKLVGLVSLGDVSTAAPKEVSGEALSDISQAGPTPAGPH